MSDFENENSEAETTSEISGDAGNEVSSEVRPAENNSGSHKADKNKRTGLIVFVAVIAVAVIYSVAQAILSSRSANSDYTVWQPSSQSSSRSVFDLYSGFPFGSQSKKETGPRIPKNQKYIAKLYITGTIQAEGSTYNQDWLLETIDMLTDDDNNVGILLVIDSPGGTVYEADSTYLALLDYKQATERPVYAYMQSMAASGGYYIACAADYIMANRNTLTGSIGVIAGTSIDLTELMEKYGIKYTTIHAGKNKNMGNYNEPLTAEQRGILQSIADECYDQFVSIVAGSRGMSVQDVERLADGRIYTASQALSNGLIDLVLMQDKDAVFSMEDRAFGGEDYETVDFKYEEDQSFYSLFTEAASRLSPAGASSGAALPKALEEMLDAAVTGPAYYYDGLFR